MTTTLVADVALDARSGGLEAVYTYRVSPKASVGDALFVPLGPRPALGFIVRIYEATEEDLGFPFSILRSAISEIDGFGLPEPVVDLACFVADQYLCPISVALVSAIPPGIKDRLVTTWSLTGALAENLNSVQAEVMRTIRDSGGKLLKSKSRPIPEPIEKALKVLRGKGLVTQSLSVSPLPEKRKQDVLLTLTSDTDRVERFLQKEGRKRPAQALTLMRLQSAERSMLTHSEIKAMAGVTETTIRALIDQDLLSPVAGDPKPLKTPPEPNRYQQLAIDAVADAVKDRSAQNFLLFGVTGSGKTEVYLRCAEAALKLGRQVLYLVPEIALATQAITQLRERFGRGVTVLHSELTPTERLENHLRIRRRECPVVLGPRSALFAGLDDIGLIIIDEEHEASFKQESAPRYHAKRLAQFLADRHGCPLVLGSATPSIETFWEAETDAITLLSLPQRAANARLPLVDVVDLKEGYQAGQPSIISEALRSKMEATLEREEQIILFLNRRAYASFLLCRDCGKEMKCPNCAVSLSFHRMEKLLRCHHCGFFARPPDICPLCGGTRIRPFGVGTEKLEEAVGELFPEARVVRLDRDVSQKKGALEKVLADFRSGATNVLVGTQMVAKGLDFPNVTLVGVIAADISMNIPDFRSSERTFQLLSQVAGRAGRGQKPGEVVIQTFQPDHIAVITAQTHDFLAFFEILKTERRQAGYPPFRRLVNIVLSGENSASVEKAAEEVRTLLEPFEGEDFKILGPVECAIERLQNRWRRHLLLKLTAGQDVSAIRSAIGRYAAKGVQCIIDVDPYSLM